MELFSEIYSSYYRTVEKILRIAARRPLSGNDLQRILSERSFSESAYFLHPKLTSGSWPLLREENKQYSAVCVPPETRLTRLQRSWLKALLRDPRFSLFFTDEEIAELDKDLSDVEPLYVPDDFFVFDGAADGDDFGSNPYREHFKAFLKAIHIKAPLYVTYEGGKGRRVTGVFWPVRLEYSQKDDKFRAICYRNTPRGSKKYVLNISRVTSATEPDVRGQQPDHHADTEEASLRMVVLEITRERNAIERCMVHFAHFEKRTEYDPKVDRYTCEIKYNVMDETEVLIRILSFGPTVKVLGPEAFVNEIRGRVNMQADLMAR